MYKKVCLFAIACIFLTSCVCTRGTEGAVLEHQRQIDSLEREYQYKLRAIRDAAEDVRAITDRNRRMEADVDEIIREFDEYQRAVERLLQRINSETGGSDQT